MALPTKSSSPMEITSGLAALQGMPIGSETQETQDALDKGIKALEARYANPNWFNVAAGFFKPQLGGFSASLGSASEALGNWQEQQRANQIPVFNAQMQGQAIIAGRQGKVKANELLASQDPNKEIPADVLRRVRILDPSEEVYNAGLAKNTEYTRLAGQKQTQVATGVTQAEGLTKLSPELFKAIPLDLSGSSTKTPEAASLKNNLVSVASKIPGVNPEQLKTMQIGDLQDFIHNYQVAQRNTAFEKGVAAAEDVMAASSDLQKLAEIRHAVDAPGVGRILNSNKGADVVSILTNYYANQSSENSANFARIMAQIKQESPDDYRAFEILIKKLSENVASARSMLTNPSNGATALLSASRPSLSNSQDAMRAMIDATAHGISSAAQTGVFRSNYKGEPTQIFNKESGFGDLQDRLYKERQEIIGNKPAAGVPSYYNIFGASVGQTPADKVILDAKKPTSEGGAKPKTAQDYFNKHLPK